MFKRKLLYNSTGTRLCFWAVLLFMTAALLQGLCWGENSQTFDKSVIMILAVHQEYDFASPWKKGATGQGVGSGFVIEGNRILTNAHNVANQRYIEVKKQNLAQRYPAQVQFVGHDCDLALITVPDPSFFVDTIPLSFGTLPSINTMVQTCGFPMGGRQVSVTKGVVSRLETSVYSHPAASRHLVVQTDAAINPGNSGGPVLQDGKVVGVAFQGLSSGDNIGYMIPTTIIDHFLKDVQDGTYNGFGTLGISIFPGLHNPYYKKYLKVPPEEDGVVLTNIPLSSDSFGKLNKEDVITKIDDFNIDNDGRVKIDGLSLEMSEIVDRKQIGEKATLHYYRDGQKHQQDLVVSHNEPIVPWNMIYDTQPEYRVYAGLTFVQLNRNFLHRWGAEWINEVPSQLRYLFMDSDQLNTDPLREEYIVLSEILPDEVNTYSQPYKYQVLKSVNGIAINKIEDLDRALKQDEEGFLTFTFIGSETPMVLDAKKARSRQDIILNKYQVAKEAKTNE